jgi:hypothetical protein
VITDLNVNDKAVEILEEHGRKSEAFSLAMIFLGTTQIARYLKY